ncbi:MAG: hypothetical protein O2930_12315 [Acidobacteria bacterium]|nr:hypothetical protein [Acidobacteriota bacterium]
MDVFRKLGDRLETRWRARDYDERAFPTLAAAVLNEAALAGTVDALDLLRWVGRNSVLPAQLDPNSSFGDMALTLYSTPGFYVSALFWLNSSTAIHQHSFSGAFQVLVGSSLHTQYQFTEQRSVNSRFRLGRLAVQRVDLLPTGAIRTIVSGERHIHSLFHLEHPSVSLIVRTHNEPTAQPQWSYLPEGISYDPFHENYVSRKKREALRVLHACGSEVAETEAREMLETADLRLTWDLLNDCADWFQPSAIEKRYDIAAVPAGFESLLEVARRRQGAEAIDRFVRSHREVRRLHDLLAIRQSLTRPEYRFLLGVLLNVTSPAMVLDLLRQRYPDRDPIAEVLDRVQELASTKVLGAREPNVVGIADYDLEHRIVLERRLRGGTFDEAVRDLQQMFPDENPEDLRHLAIDISQDLAGSALLRTLVNDPNPANAQNPSAAVATRA